MTHVKNVESKVDVELKRKTLENRMKVREKGTVDEILGCIEELADDPGVDAVDPAEEGTFIENIEEEEEAAAEEEARQEELLSKRRSKKKSFNSRVANKEMHPNMTEDVWVLGKKKQLKADVLLVRSASEDVARKRRNLRKAIVRNIKERNENTRQCYVGIEIDGLPPWQLFFRSKKNNIKLS